MVATWIGQVLDMAAKMLPGCFHPLSSYLSTYPWLHFQSQLPIYVHPGRQKVMAQLLGSLPPMYEGEIEFWVLVFGLD